jgi:5-bromo-4-chloroindolyl phosphate hydrolysis protein
MYYNMDPQNLSLTEALIELKIHCKKIEAENKFLHKQIAELSEQNKNLIKQLNDSINELNNLKDKLNINSSNSGLPTSKEIYQTERKTRPRSGRKVGGASWS